MQICDLFCINQPFTTNFSFEKNSCIGFELSLLIDYTSYHYEIFSVASTGTRFLETKSASACMVSLPPYFDSFYSNPETRVAKLSVAIRVGGCGEGGVWAKRGRL